VGAVLSGEDDEVMMITDSGSLIRMRSAEISMTSRNTQGVRLMGLDAGERLVGLEKIEEALVLGDVETGADSQAATTGGDTAMGGDNDADL
jgi:DNA gyrase subunit A